MPNTITDQIRNLRNHLRGDLKEVGEAIKAQIEQQRLVGEIGDEAAAQLVANVNIESARIRQGQGEGAGSDRDILQALPVIDGPFKGMTFAHSADYFYAAQLDAPGLTRPTLVPDRNAGMGRTLYRLQHLADGRQVWSCSSE
jgi:hypothetical protein